MNRGRVITTALLLAVLICPMAASGAIQEAGGARYALIVDSHDNEGAAALAGVLRELYGFEVIDLVGPGRATREEIRSAMQHLYEVVRPYDQLVVHLSLPVTRVPELFYVPEDGDPARTWTLLEGRELISWLNELFTGAALITHPSCASQSRSPYGDPQLEELAYTKRPGPVEVVLVCDYQALKMRRRYEESGPIEWRGDEVAMSFAESLQQAAMASDQALMSADLALAASEQLEEMDFEVLTIPLTWEPSLRFAPIVEADDYRTRYTRATSYDQVVTSLQDYVAAGAERSVLQQSLIGFLRAIALSPVAEAGAAGLNPREVLQLRNNAVDILGRIGTEAARDALGKISTDAGDSALLRQAAVSTLYRQPDLRPADLAVLGSAIEDQDPTVREAAVRGLILADVEGAGPLLSASIPHEEDLRVRIAMMEGLASLARPEDAGLFIGLTEDDHWGTRRMAVVALSKLEPAVPVNEVILAVLANDAVDSVREAAASALGSTFTSEDVEVIGEALIATLEPRPDGGASWDAVRAAAARSLGKIGGPQAEAALRRIVSDLGNSERLLVAAIEALGQMRSGAAISELRSAADAELTRVREAAVLALGEIGTPEAGDILLAKLEDPDPGVREATRSAVGNLQLDPSQVLQGTQSESDFVRLTAVNKLGRSKEPESVDALLEALSDPDPRVREAAIQGLATHSSEAALEKVIEAFQRGDLATRVGTAAVLGLRRTDQERRVLEVLAAGCEDQNVEMRAAAVRALGMRRDPEALGTISRTSHDGVGFVRSAAAEALGELIEMPEAYLRLQEMATSDLSLEVRQTAIRVLSSRPRARKK